MLDMQRDREERKGDDDNDDEEEDVQSFSHCSTPSTTLLSQSSCELNEREENQEGDELQHFFQTVGALIPPICSFV